MVFHKGKMYRMGNGNIPPFTKEILLLICSVREMFSTCAQAIVKNTAYIVGYRNTAMSKSSRQNSATALNNSRKQSC